jgi:hypothetical protein
VSESLEERELDYQERVIIARGNVIYVLLEACQKIVDRACAEHVGKTKVEDGLLVTLERALDERIRDLVRDMPAPYFIGLAGDAEGLIGRRCAKAEVKEFDHLVCDDLRVRLDVAGGNITVDFDAEGLRAVHDPFGSPVRTWLTEREPQSNSTQI